MLMQMGFRWYGEGNDKISLSDIRQIPGVSTIVWALHDKLPGEIWQPEEIKRVVDLIPLEYISEATPADFAVVCPKCKGKYVLCRHRESPIIPFYNLPLYSRVAT